MRGWAVLDIIKSRLKRLSGWAAVLSCSAMLLSSSTVFAYTNINDTTSQNDQVMYDWLNREKPAKATSDQSTNTSTIAPIYPNAEKSGYVTFDSGKDLLNQLRASTPVPTIESSDYDYYIDRYDINMIVNEDNTYDITEKLKVHYNEPRHGIIRKIPTYNEVTRPDGSKTNNRARISDIKTSVQYYSIGGDGQYQSIKIGDPDETITGDKTYEIKYKYDIGRDKLANADEFYFNLIGPEWDTAIREVNFTIQMPKSFDRSKLSFSSGPIRSTNGSNILYTVNGNTIYGINKNYLPAANALTIRLTLPDGYYQRTMTFMEWLADNYWWLGMTVAGILLLAVIVIWFMRGRDGLVTKVISYGPPDGMNSLDVDMIYNGYPTRKGVISMLIYLANKGYVKIHVDAKSNDVRAHGQTKASSDGGETYRIEKIKKYNGKIKTERLFLSGLFAGGKTTVTEDNLYNNFYSTVSDVIYSEAKSDLAKRLFVNNRGYQITIIILMILVLFTIPTLGLFMLGSGPELIVPGMACGIGAIIALVLCLSMGTSPTDNRQNCLAVLSLASSTLLGSLAVAVCFGFGYRMIAGALLPYYWAMLAVCCMVAVAMSMLLVVTTKRSEMGGRLLGQVRGLKDFLKTAEKSRIEAMVEDNPNFFYDILPYAYVLGVTDVWTKKFESMGLRAPNWYDSPVETSFDIYVINGFMNSTMPSISDTMLSAPESTSGFDIGFSGGGFGGGGGSSW